MTILKCFLLYIDLSIRDNDELMIYKLCAAIVDNWHIRHTKNVSNQIKIENINKKY